jgi:hypothetical protein
MSATRSPRPHADALARVLLVAFALAFAVLGVSLVTVAAMPEAATATPLTAAQTAAVVAEHRDIRDIRRVHEGGAPHKQGSHCETSSCADAAAASHGFRSAFDPPAFTVCTVLWNLPRLDVVHARREHQSAPLHPSPLLTTVRLLI